MKLKEQIVEIESLSIEEIRIVRDAIDLLAAMQDNISSTTSSLGLAQKAYLDDGIESLQGILSTLPGCQDQSYQEVVELTNHHKVYVVMYTNKGEPRSAKYKLIVAHDFDECQRKLSDDSTINAFSIIQEVNFSKSDEIDLIK